MLGAELRHALHEGTPVYGTHITTLSNFASLAVLLQAELDFAFICGEHMPLDGIEVCNLCQFYRTSGVTPVVRLSHPDPAEAAQMLDRGAQGIVVPYVETVAEVRAMAAAVHYRPLKGEQLDQILDGGSVSSEMNQFFKRFNHDNLLIIGIESVTAYKRLDELISIPGVDGVFLGPHDLTVSTGHAEEWDHPEWLEIIRDTIVRCRAAGIGVGAHMPPAIFTDQKARELVDLGMNWILDGADVGWALKALKHRRQLLAGDKRPATRQEPLGGPAGCANVRL